MSGSQKKINITAFLDADGKITRIPAPNKTKKPVLAYLTDKFEVQRKYTEKEVNEIISKWHTFNDYFILRRLLVDHNFFERTSNGAQYWVVENEEEKQVSNNEENSR